MPIKLAVFFHRFGPYHIARLRAASACGHGEILAVELCTSAAEYAWDSVPSPDLNRVVVCTTGDSNDLPGPELTNRVETVLNDHKPDVLAVAGWRDKGMLAAARWGLRHRKPMIIMSDSQERDESRKWHKEAVKRIIVSGFGAGLVAGSPHADYLAKLGMPRDRIFTGYDVVDNRHFAGGADAARRDGAATRQRLNLPPAYFLASGRFIEKKNFATLLEAFALFRGRHPDSEFYLVLVGDGPLKTPLVEQSRRLGIDSRVLFPGFVQYDSLPAYYGLAAALIVPSSHSEQWALVVNEAMAAGLPVLVSEICGCVPDLVKDGKNGWTFPSHNADDLANLLDRLITDADVRPQMGECSRQIVRAWSTLKFAENLWSASRRSQSRICRDKLHYRRVVLKNLTD